MKRTSLALILGLILPLVASSAVEADILWFKNGRSMEGSVRDLPDGKVEITLSYGTLAFSRNQVDRVEKALSVAEIVDQALATLSPTDTERLFELAQWCREKREYTLAGQLYERVLSVDPNHAGARQQLGYELRAGQWLTEEEARLARGEVPFRGEWVSRRDRDQQLSAERNQYQRRRIEDLEEARLALEISRFELETERARRLPPPQGLPLYPFGSGIIQSPGVGFVLPHGNQATTQRTLNDPIPQDSTRRRAASRRASDRRASERPRHYGTIPRHQRGDIGTPKRR